MCVCVCVCARATKAKYVPYSFPSFPCNAISPAISASTFCVCIILQHTHACDSQIIYSDDHSARNMALHVLKPTYHHHFTAQRLARAAAGRPFGKRSFINSFKV